MVKSVQVSVKKTAKKIVFHKQKSRVLIGRTLSLSSEEKMAVTEEAIRQRNGRTIG